MDRRRARARHGDPQEAEEAMPELPDVDGSIAKATVAGRATYFCDTHQRGS